MDQMIRSLLHRSEAWSRDWGLTAFLALLIVYSFIISPLDNLTGFGHLLISIFLSLLLVAGVAAIAEKKAATILATIFVVIIVALRWTTHLVSSPGLATISAISSIIFLGLLAVVVMRRVFGKGPINLHRIQGAIAVYLLLGLIWAIAYEAIMYQIPDAFHPADLGMQSGHHISSLVYFSFVTLTTVGYGDITPAHPIVRSLSNLEALVGQLYPAILIGRLVAMELSSRQSRSTRHDDGS